MRPVFPIILFLQLLISLSGKCQSMDIAGQYMLRGVNETAAGFKFSADSTFEFFLSYGASDRYAKGTYSQIMDTIILKGDKIPGKDFAVTKSSKQGSGTVLQVNNQNEILKDKIICIFFTNGIPELNYTDNNGKCFYSARADSVQLVHPFYPDEPTVIVLSLFPSGHNFFELSLQPELEMLCFLQMPIKIRDSKFSCKLPWITGDVLLNFHKEDAVK